MLVFGRGWMGTQWAARHEDAVLADTDIADAPAVAATLDEIRPERVVNAAGRTGHPNVDALEGRPADTYRSNVVGPLVLAIACRQRGLHLTHLGSGCVYSGDNAGRGFAEDDAPNFQGSLYARSKAAAEASLRDFDVLQLRIRLPLASVPHPRNLLTKLLTFDRVVRIANSVTVLDDAWPVADQLVARGEGGVWNLVNPGAEYHDELLALWRERVDPTHAFEVVDLASLDLRAGRSNCVLSTAKLETAGLALPPLAASLPRLVDAYALQSGHAHGDAPSAAPPGADAGGDVRGEG